MASLEILDKGIKGKERYKVSYEIRTPDNKRHRKSKTFKPGVSKRVVETFKRQMENEYADGIITDISRRTFAEYAEEYFENYMINLSPTTQDGYKKMYYNSENGLKLAFGNMQLDKIEPLQIQKFINHMLKKGKSPKTVKNYVMLMDTMFEKAIRLRYIKRGFNPVKEVDLPKIQKNEIEAYTEEELKTLLRLMDKCEDKILSACIKIIVGTGIRRGEVCGLRIENFSSERKEIKITEAIVYAENKNISKTPKSNAGRRTISLPDSVVEVIEERIREYKLNKLKLGKKFHDEGYIICHEDGSVFSPTILYNRYKKFMQKHSDELRYLSLHKLRHTFASLSISYNMDIKALQETLGHADAMTTLNTYAHGYKKEKQKQANLLDRNIFQTGVS